MWFVSFSFNGLSTFGSMDGWMGLADQLLLLLLLWLVCVWCVNGPGLSVCLSAGWLAG